MTGSVLGRFLALAVIFVVLALIGPAALLPGAFALIVVRTVLIRRQRSDHSDDRPDEQAEQSDDQLAPPDEPGAEPWT